MAKLKINTLIYIFIFSLPFTYAMTLKIGFNIKIYEIIAFLLLFYFIFKQVKSQKIFYKTKYKNIYILFTLYVVFTILSNLFSLYDFTSINHNYIWAVGRFAPYINSISPIIYLILIFFIFFYLLEKLNERLIYKVIKYWLIGAFISGLYLIYSNVAIYTGLPEIILPGMDNIRYSGFGNFIFAREGTFREGNFLSAYLVASIVLLHILYIKTKQKKLIFLGIYFIIALFLTVSTSGIISLFIYFNIYFLLMIFYFKSKTALKKWVLFYLIIFLSIYFSPLFDLLYDIIYLKLFSSNIDYSPMAYSKFDRLYHLQKGIEIFKEHYLFGIGSYNFGYYFPMITDSNIFSDGTEYKKIINNVYVQILVENGIFTFLFFISIFILIIKRFIRKRQKDILDIISISFLISILIRWNAYPTYLLMFDWISIIIIIYLLWRKNEDIY